MNTATQNLKKLLKSLHADYLNVGSNSIEMGLDFHIKAKECLSKYEFKVI